MAIVEETYYINTYIGEPVATADFPRYEAMAERAINTICRNGYNSLLSRLSEQAAANLTEAYKNAICAQIEYYVANGIMSITAGQSSENFTVGKVSVSSGGAGASFENRGPALISPTAIAYLEQTGLLNRSINAPVDPFAPFPVGVV